MRSGQQFCSGYKKPGTLTSAFSFHLDSCKQFRGSKCNYFASGKIFYEFLAIQKYIQNDISINQQNHIFLAAFLLLLRLGYNPLSEFQSENLSDKMQHHMCFLCISGIIPDFTFLLKWILHLTQSLHNPPFGFNIAAVTQVL